MLREKTALVPVNPWSWHEGKLAAVLKWQYTHED